MAVVDSKQVIFKGNTGNAQKESDLELKDGKIKLEAPKGSGAILVKNVFLSCDPDKRGCMAGLSESYIAALVPCQPLEGYGVSTVIDSDNPAFKPGDLVASITGWEEYSLIHRTEQCRKIDQDEIPRSYHLGLLGMLGFTSYAGFFEVCTPKKEEFVFVSAASGTVGQLLGELAKKRGCYVVGSAGTSQEVHLMKKKLGFDEAFNYKEEPDFNAALKRYFPEGIDIYVDNVGGDMLDASLLNMRIDGRIAIQGNILGAALLYQGIFKNGITKRMKKASNISLLAMKHKRVKIVYIEGMNEGLDGAPAAFVGLFSGKKVIRTAKKLAKMLAKMLVAASLVADLLE